MRRKQKANQCGREKKTGTDNGTASVQLSTLALLSCLCLCGLPASDRKCLSVVLEVVNPLLDPSTQIMSEMKKGCLNHVCFLHELKYE